MVSAVASQQEGPGFESRPFCVELACSPRVCVGFLRVLRFPPTSKDMHSILSLPRDQGTGIRTGVGPRALHCGCPLFLTSLGWVKCRGRIYPPGLIKYDLYYLYLQDPYSDFDGFSTSQYSPALCWIQDCIRHCTDSIKVQQLGYLFTACWWILTIWDGFWPKLLGG